jgi:hypothetical protein
MDGAGRRLFGDGGLEGAFTLKKCQATETGVAILTYVPAS